MQIVIDIPSKEVPNKQEIIDINLHFIDGEVCECTYPYIVLPKEHGRLIDADEALKAMNTYDKFGYLPHNLIPLVSENGLNLVPYVHYDDIVACITYAPTIIEADAESEGEE